MTAFLAELAARRRFGMRPGLETIRNLCALLGDPQTKLRAVHVAGTNGKGAVCALLDAALRRLGRRVGRYTSPHLVRLNERFFLDGQPVGDATLERLSQRVSAVCGAREVTFFEALTAVAFLLYAEAGATEVILECGLGGRLDATNICIPELCVITRIGLDHCDWLGETVEKIAAEKAGILKPDVPVVLGANDEAVSAVVEARAKAVGAPFFYAPDWADAAELPADLSLGGAFNRENAITAIAALKVLLAHDQVAVTQALSGFSSAIWPGRFQRVGGVLVDGAHNPPAAEALARSLAAEGTPPKSLDLICGFCGDKDVVRTLEILAPFVRRGLGVRTVNPRALSAAEVAARMQAVGIPAASCASLAEAFAAADLSATLVCGSLFLAGEALVALGAYPWAISPRFDCAEAL